MMFLPLTKVDEEQKKIYLTATSETVDKQNQSLDYEKSKPEFEKWSNEVQNISFGKSYGNIRQQHDSTKPIGKVCEPLQYDDENKKIDIVVKVVDDAAWELVKAGVLSGGSIGGAYKSKRYDPTLGCTKYIPVLSEISLVDMPCNPDSVFTLIKSNGTLEIHKFKESNMSKKLFKKAVSDELFKTSLAAELSKSMSDVELTNRLQGAVGESIKVPYGTDPDSVWFYVSEVYQSDGYCIVTGDLDGDNDTDNYKFNFTVDGDTVKITGDGRMVRRGDWVDCLDESGDPSDSNIQVALTKEANTDEPVEKMLTHAELDKTVAEIKAKEEIKECTKENGGEVLEECSKTKDIEKADKMTEQNLAKVDELTKTNSELLEKVAKLEDDLQKAGSKFSKTTLEKLQKAHHAIADVAGDDGVCKCEKCSPATEVHKVAPAEPVQKSAEITPTEESKPHSGIPKIDSKYEEIMQKVDGLAKTNESLTQSVESLQKAVEGFEKSEIDLKKVNVELEETNKDLLEKVATFGNLPNNSNLPAKFDVKGDVYIQDKTLAGTKPNDVAKASPMSDIQQRLSKAMETAWNNPINMRI